MANGTVITDPKAIAFSNQRVRYVADEVTRIYYTLKSFVDDWNYEQMATVLPPGGTSFVDDGSAGAAQGSSNTNPDGRNPITSDDCYSIVLRATDIITALEANNNANLASIVKVSPFFVKF